MKIRILEKPRVICSNRDNPRHATFAWPSVTRLPGGKLAMVASGFRLRHVCPFGKVVICYSSDEGKTWTRPAVIMDTPLDDRDAGIAVFGKDKSKVIVTSFNNSVKFQRDFARSYPTPYNPYIEGYLDVIEKAQCEEKYLGSTYCISNDGGLTFGEVKRIPVTCPHGPAVTSDGRLIYVGTRFDAVYGEKDAPPTLECYTLDDSGEFIKTGVIPDIIDTENPDAYHYSCEPHAIVLPDGKIIVQIRSERTFTLWQSESEDGGKTFSAPKRLLPDFGGAPAHLMLHSSGVLISAYGYRLQPYGIRVMLSRDDGRSWEKDFELFTTSAGSDLGYPCSTELNDGSILTVFYAKQKADNEYWTEPSEIMQVIWKIEE